jgi:hypothetical protein
MINTGVAQLAEHRSPKPGVEGSTPSARVLKNIIGKKNNFLV